MIIYVECVLLNNFAIDFLMGYLSLLTLRRDIKGWRMCLAALIGSGYALVYPLIEFKGDIVLKLAVALAMCAVLAKPLSLKKYAILSLVFLAYSFGFGGLLTALMNMSQPIREVLSNPANINIGLSVTLVILLLVFGRKIVQLCIKHKGKEGNVKRVIINKGHKLIVEKGYYDSGNTMYFKGIYPVIVIDESLKSDDKAVGCIDIDTIGGRAKKDVYKLSKIMIENRSYDSVYCIFNKLNNGYKVLLHNDTF